MTQTALFVLGMHRSGTSPITGVLQLLGVELGHDLTPGVVGVNDKGFWEHAEILALHERLLADLDQRWDEITVYPERWWLRTEVDPYRIELDAFIDREFGSTTLWGVKDPRLCHLLPVWRSVLERRDIQQRALIIVRHPVEVAASLQRRDGMDPGYARLLWAQHLLAAERNTRDMKRVFVTFEELLTDSMACIAKISDALEIQWPIAPFDVEKDIDALLEDRLRHHRISSGEAVVEPWISDVFEILKATSASDATLAVRLAPARELADSLALTLGAEVKQDRRKILRIGTALEQAIDTVHRLEAANRALQSTLLTLTTQALGEPEQPSGPFPVAEPASSLKLQDVSDDDGEEVPLASAATKEYAGVIDLNVENNSHTKMIKMIGATSNGRRCRILDTGCSTGYFGEALKAQGHEVWGVEINPEAAAQAAERLDKVFALGIESFLNHKDTGQIKFDYITFGDVLEHVVDPIGVLRRCMSLLSPEGRVLASIPNVAHRAVRAMLLGGAWRYGDFGILDNTHLRFFDRQGVVDLMSEGGYGIEQLDRVIVAADLCGVEFDSQLLEEIEPFICDPDADVFQFIVSAKPGSIKNNSRFYPNQSQLPRILVVSECPDAPSTTQQIIEPIRTAMIASGGDLGVSNIDSVSDCMLERASVVVLDDMVTDQALNLAAAMDDVGKSVVLRLRTPVAGVPERYAESLRRRVELVESTFDQLLAHVTAVAVPTHELLRQLSDRVQGGIVANRCEPIPAAHSEQPETPVALVLCGENVPPTDFLIPVLPRLLEQAEPDIRIIGIGPVGRILADAGIQVERHEIMDADMLATFLASVPNSIGLFPLGESGYETASHSAAFMIFSGSGIPSVCSALPPFSDELTDGVNALLRANSADAWLEGLSSLISEPELKRSIGQHARQLVQTNHGFDAIVQQWHDLLFALPTRPQVGIVPTPRRRTKVLCLLPIASWTIGDIRIVDPLTMWCKVYGGEIRVKAVSEYAPVDLDWSDVLVLQRESDPKTLEILNRAHLIAKRVVFDIDDLLTDVPEFLSVHEHSKSVFPYLAGALSAADAISVTTERLRGEMQAYNDSVFVVPNCLDNDVVAVRHRDDEPVKLLVASSDTVRVDFIVTTLLRLVDQPNFDVRIIAIGPPGDFLGKAGLQVEQHDLMDRRGFRAFLTTLDNAIGVIPLDDSRFSGCKSAIKFVDFSLAGIPCVCSQVPPYSDIVEAGITGMLCTNSADAWTDSLLRLCASAGLRGIIASNARGMCRREHSLRHAADAWEYLFRQIESRPIRTQKAKPMGMGGLPRFLRTIGNSSLGQRWKMILLVIKHEGLSGFASRAAQKIRRL